MSNLRQGVTTWAKKKQIKSNIPKKKLEMDFCPGVEGCDDGYGAWNDCLLSGTPSQGFPTSLGPKGQI